MKNTSTVVSIPLFVETREMQATSISRIDTVRLNVTPPGEVDHRPELTALLKWEESREERDARYALIERCFACFCIGAYLALVHILAFLHLVQG